MNVNAAVKPVCVMRMPTVLIPSATLRVSVKITTEEMDTHVHVCIGITVNIYLLDNAG